MTFYILAFFTIFMYRATSVLPAYLNKN